MNKNIMSYVKKLTAGVLAVGMIVAGIVVVPKQADAAVAKDVVIYENLDIATYWNNGKKAPVKEGYVFGGWFTETTDETAENKETLTLEDGTSPKTCVPLTEKQIDANEDGTVDAGVSAIAKFVPAQVLSVKAQNQSGVDADYISNLNKDWVKGQEKDYFWIRVMTSLDSKNYAKIGFDIHLANKEEGLTLNNDGVSPLETTKIYDAVMEEVNGKQEVSTAENIFGGASDYVCVWQLSKIDTASNAKKIIYVRPYWYTMDGTKVLGLAKYVHIEDEYLNYISVPVNLLGGEKIAAGAVDVTYGGNETLQLIGFEAGRILPQMNHNYTDKTIKMVGNTDKAVNSFNEGETIYANLRFAKPTADTEFNITYGQFCDWSETILTDMKKAWDTKYVKETTSE